MKKILKNSLFLILTISILLAIGLTVSAEETACIVTFGENAPVELNKGETVSIPSVPATSLGYYFIGWKTDGDDTIYFPNEEYVVETDTTFYPAWSAALVVPSKTAKTGEILSIPVTIFNNWYADSISLLLEYDKDALELLYVKNENAFDSLEYVDVYAEIPEINLNSRKSENGTAFTINFNVKDSSLLTDTSINIKRNTIDYPTTSEVYTLRKDTSKFARNIATQEDATNFSGNYILIDEEIMFAGQGTVSGFINVSRAQYGTQTVAHTAGTAIKCLDQDFKPIKITIGTPVTIESGSCGENATYTLNSDGLLTISGTGQMDLYLVDSTAPWYSKRAFIKRVVIENGVTSIGYYAFRNCINLINVTIPDSVTSIGSSAFYYCTSLASITIPDSVTTISDYAFKGCSNLTIHGYSGSYAETYANENNISFVAITDNIASGTISDTVTWVIGKNGVLTVSGEGEIPDYGRTSDQAPWYAYRTQVTAIVVEDGITSIGNYAFLALANAESLEIAESVKYIGQFVFREIGLTEFTVSHDVELAPFALARMDKLTTLTFTEDVKNFKGNVFTAKNAQTITIKAPEGSFAHKYSELYPEKYPSTAALVTLEFESTGAAVAPIVVFESAGDNVFYAIYEKDSETWALEVNGRGEMKNFPYISDKNMSKGYKFTPMHYIVEKGNLEEQKIKSIIVHDGITTIGNYAFYKCNKATSLILPDGITSIGNGAFWACAKIEGIVLPETVKTIGNHAFNNCKNLTSVTIPDSVTEIGKDIFVKCNTDNIKVATENAVALDYFGKNYPNTLDTEELLVRVVGTANYSLNGAKKSNSDSIVNIAPINTDGTLGTAFELVLADCGLHAYENNSDALIGLDITTVKKNGVFVSGAAVLGTLKSAEVTLSDDLTEILIDGTAYSDLTNLKKLEYGTNTVTTENQFTEISDLKYPHVALALDHEGDGVVDAIAVDYIKLAKVIRVEDGKCYVTSGVTSDTETGYVMSNELAEDDVFVYAQINGITYVEEIITPVAAKATKVTTTVITLADVGEINYVDGANGDTYLKSSGSPITFNATELLSSNAKALDYYIYNNHVVAVVTPIATPVYNPAILLYVKEPTDPVYNPETKKIEIYYPAVLLIDGVETTVNLDFDAAINGKTATDDFVRSFELSDDAVYHNLLVEYTIDEVSGFYSLYTVSTYQNDARLIRYCAERSAAEVVDGVAYYSHCFLDFTTMKNGAQVVDTDVSVTDGAVITNAGYFYGKDPITKKYVNVTVGNSNAVQIANVTGFNKETGVLTLDSDDFPNGIEINGVNVWGAAGNTAYNYKVFTTETLAELYTLATENSITLEAAVGTYVDDDGNLQIAWILIDNYYYANELLTQTFDIVEKLK